jgi:general secretion pathway protein B
MSIILNALKKSEAQRRLGQSPTLAETAAISTVPNTPTRSNRWWSLLVVLVIFLLAWYFRDSILSDPDAQMPDSVAEPPPAAATGNDLADLAREAEATLQEAQPATVNKAITTAGAAAFSTPVEDYTAPPSVAVAENSGENPQTEIIEQEPVQLITQAPSESPPRSVGTEPLSVYEIPRDIRSSLPAINTTLQVFAQQPEDRFAVVNGRRLTEGAELAPGLVLVEIRKRGLVFSYRNYRFVVN